MPELYQGVTENQVFWDVTLSMGSSSQHYKALQHQACHMLETTSLVKQHNTPEGLDLQQYYYKN